MNTFLILGNQLFPIKHLTKYKKQNFVMFEDHGLCTYKKHHKLKITLFLTAMRAYSKNLKEKDFNITYHELNDKNLRLSFEEKLTPILKKSTKLTTFEIEDKFFEDRIYKLCKDLKVAWEVIPSPMFLSNRENFKTYLKDTKKPFMKTFYQKERKRLGILIDKNNKPYGGKWSYDTENRSKLPKDLTLPKVSTNIEETSLLKSVKTLVSSVFKEHVGCVDDFWLPYTRKAYLKALDEFLIHKFQNFGTYQDSITDKSPFLFHSLLSPGLNMGLITPEDIVSKTLEFSKKTENKIPLNSLEGFIRQVIGWREFLRGIYQEFSEEQETTNFFNHKRKMKSVWYTGNTGLPPVDDAIKKALKYGYNHHIERLMILSNVMLMTEIEPTQVHDWFMEMYVDSSDWVMGPNVYGMGQFSDGGIFATKPYISGSNYILKMSDYKKGVWCDVMDGLYWQFIFKKQDFLKSNPRLNMMLSTLERMSGEKKERIFNAAEQFRNETTD